MKILIAVLSSRCSPWVELMEASKKTWDAPDVPDVQTIYYVGEPASALVDRVVGFDVREGYSGLGRRNLLAYEWALSNMEWDLMVRVNASTYVRKAAIAEYCKSLPTEGLVVGANVLGADPPWMWGGFNYILSRDVVQNLVSHPEFWPHRHMEDVAMSQALTRLGYTFEKVIPAGSIEMAPSGYHLISTLGIGGPFSDFKELMSMPVALFRVKQDLRRHLDIEIMQKLYEADQHA